MIKQVDYAYTLDMKCDRCGKDMNWDGETRTETPDEKEISLIERWRCSACNRQILFRKKYAWLKSEIMTVR